MPVSARCLPHRDKETKGLAESFGQFLITQRRARGRFEIGNPDAGL